MANKTTLQRVQEAIDAPPVINTDVNINIIRSNTRKEERKYKCTCCNDSWNVQKGNFSKTKSIIYQSNNGYITICNKCRDEYYYQLVDLFSGNEEKAIAHMCAQFGWFFHAMALEAAPKEISHDRSRISSYLPKINLPQTSMHGTTDIDTLKFNYKNRKEEVIETLDDIEDKTKTKVKTVKFFGTGFTDEDYAYLQEQYIDWTTRHECKTKAQEEVFKRICFKQLEILKATRDGKDTKDLDKTYQDLLSTAKLQPKQTDTDALSKDRTFGQLIKIWEDEKPIPEPEKEFKDVDGIAKYLSVYFLGHLAKMVGIKNRFSRMYEEEMKKYTVEKPEYEEDTEALFDAIFGGRMSNNDTTEDGGSYDQE